MPTLFHFSEQPDIQAFTPRPSADGRYLVWAIASSHQQNYLLPRGCPRICIHVRPQSTKADQDQFLGQDKWRIIVERRCMAKIAEATLYRYEFAQSGFQLQDDIAGYHTSETTQVPLACSTISDLPAAIAQTGTTLIAQDSLHSLAAQVARSTLGFSIIRMRNAGP